MKEIHGEAKTIRQLLSGTRYSIDYYQREYRWQSKQILELIDDLANKFLQDYKAGDERAAVQNYGHYFLGSIIISRKNNESFIIDGQQRLTSLTLLLIYLHNHLEEADDRSVLTDLIFSVRYAKRSFNIHVEDRTPAMDALFTNQPFDSTDKPEAIRNIIGRYQDIEKNFPEEIDKHALPYFADWLIENVHLVEIVAFSDDDAYTIFETMNDRGLSLSPLDMLKGYLLANITDEPQKLAANKLWKDRVLELADLGKEEDSDAFKAWLRSQYAKTIRERKKGAEPGDFDRLGTEFHRWVKDHDTALGLTSSAQFAQFIQRDMDFYTRQYMRLRKASWQLDPDLEQVFYNAQHGFTLQYPVLLAPLTPSDDHQTINRKLRIVASFIDILLARRLWNFRTITYSTMQYAMFLAMHDIRGKNPQELVTILQARLDRDAEPFAHNDRLRLHQQNRAAIHQILARITDHVERQAGYPSHFTSYVADGKNRFEIEHIWADHPERHTDEFSNSWDFAEYRNRIGDLLLLPKSFNASYGDMTYAEKREHYNAQNLLARSLHEQSYDHNPGFVQYLKRSGLPFQPHAQFLRADLDARQALYMKLAEEIWNPDRLHTEAEQ